METFELDSAIVHSLTDELRHDANSLPNLDLTPCPSDHWFAQFHAAFEAARDFTNTRADELRNAARRVAANMDLAVSAASAVETRTSETLGGML